MKLNTGLKSQKFMGVTNRQKPLQILERLISSEEDIAIVIYIYDVIMYVLNIYIMYTYIIMYII